jgi:hypothetical protein
MEIRKIKEIKGKTENWIREKPGNTCKQVFDVRILGASS